eukprot:3144365-Amphidinium_carterae.2
MSLPLLLKAEATLQWAENVGRIGTARQMGAGLQPRKLLSVIRTTLKPIASVDGVFSTEWN